MNLFKTEEPYRIADKITNESELSPDLVVHVYFIMLKKTEEIDNEAAYFARTAYQQWNWHNSDFSFRKGSCKFKLLFLSLRQVHTNPTAGNNTIIPPFWIRPSSLNWEEQQTIHIQLYHTPLCPIHIPPVPYDAMI